ncbi:histidine kinase [Scytonema hofmannii PCC 7110]|uniref:histidine kinase n=1 Tax=Scytonema hofmannii PCC 7110 TaxID=128403 RepID=A0A139WXI7_9CYAN|nr:ATP-binding protein [Scytonema hofmannii]KYC37123.1 histidine kinase [Scytonema hofmannii PCC 7110]
MKLLQSVSTRLTLTLLSVTLGSFVAFSFTLDTALKQFFVQDAQASLKQQANALATQAQINQNNFSIVNQLAGLTSQQGKVQVVVFYNTTEVRIISQGVQDSRPVKIPSDLVLKTLAGVAQRGSLQVEGDSHYPWWLYSTTPIRDVTSNQVVGAVYVAMPLRRPRQFAQQVKGLVMGMAIVAVTVAVTAGLLLSRTLTNPLQVLHRQARQLEAGDYTARSALKGNDELAQLSRLLDQMTHKLMQTLMALQAQETARRELVANVSHDLRTPLTSLRLGLEAVIDGMVTGDKALNYLKRSCRETDYLSHLVERLLLLSKVDAGQLQIQPQAVSVVAIAQECIFRMQPSAMQADLKLELCVTSPVPTIWVDPELTGQVILSLLDNAIKYAPNSQVVHLNVLAPVEIEQHQYVPLQVQDYGQGITPELLKRVTERFYRGDNARPRGGFGLGLAIAHQVCQLQACPLKIESEEGQGTVVTLLLPVVE